MSGRLAKRVALVFGAGAQGEGIGNGKAAAILYAREGATVVAVDINRAAADETVKLIKAEGGAAIALQADVSKSDSVKTVIDETVRQFQRIDILHNNVALPPALGPFTKISEETWDNTFAINVKGMFLACKHTLPVMVAQGSGVITNISAVASVRYLGPAATYSATKGAINALTISIAEEFAKSGVRCNAILPGFMDTPLGLGMYQGEGAAEKVAARNAKLPTGKPGDGWDVGAAAVFLASDEAKYVNGVLLPVDGGYIGKGA